MWKLKLHPFALLGAIASIVMGIGCLFGDPSSIIHTIYYLIGTGLILTGLFKVLVLSNGTNQNPYALTEGIFNIITALVLFFFHNFIITLILGAIFVIFPIARIIKSKDRKESFLQELPLLILGLIIMFSGDFFVKVFVRIVGVLFILLAIYLLIEIFRDQTPKQNNNYYDSYLKEEDYQKMKDENNVIDAKYEERDLDE